MLWKLKLHLQLLYYRLLLRLGLKKEEIYYIGGSEALPPPLTREEEEILLQKASYRRCGHSRDADRAQSAAGRLHCAKI